MFSYRQSEVQSAFQQDFIKNIFFPTVGFNVGNEVFEIFFVKIKINFPRFNVGGVELEYLETKVYPPPAVPGFSSLILAAARRMRSLPSSAMVW